MIELLMFLLTLLIGIIGTVVGTILFLFIGAYLLSKMKGDFE